MPPPLSKAAAAAAAAAEEAERQAVLEKQLAEENARKAELEAFENTEKGVGNLNWKQRSKALRSGCKAVKSKDLEVRMTGYRRLTLQPLYFTDGDVLTPLLLALVPKKRNIEALIPALKALGDVFSSYAHRCMALSKEEITDYTPRPPPIEEQDSITPLTPAESAFAIYGALLKDEVVLDALKQSLLACLLYVPEVKSSKKRATTASSSKKRTVPSSTEMLSGDEESASESESDIEIPSSKDNTFSNTTDLLETVPEIPETVPITPEIAELHFWTLRIWHFLLAPLHDRIEIRQVLPAISKTLLGLDGLLGGFHRLACDYWRRYVEEEASSTTEKVTNSEPIESPVPTTENEVVVLGPPVVVIPESMSRPLQGCYYALKVAAWAAVVSEGEEGIGAIADQFESLLSLFPSMCAKEALRWQALQVVCAQRTSRKWQQSLLAAGVNLHKMAKQCGIDIELWVPRPPPVEAVPTKGAKKPPAKGKNAIVETPVVVAPPLDPLAQFETSHPSRQRSLVIAISQYIGMWRAMEPEFITVEDVVMVVNNMHNWLLCRIFWKEVRGDEGVPAEHPLRKTLSESVELLGHLAAHRSDLREGMLSSGGAVLLLRLLESSESIYRHDDVVPTSDAPVAGSQPVVEELPVPEWWKDAKIQLQREIVKACVQLCATSTTPSEPLIIEECAKDVRWVRALSVGPLPEEVSIYGESFLPLICDLLIAPTFPVRLSVLKILSSITLGLSSSSASQWLGTQGVDERLMTALTALVDDCSVQGPVTDQNHVIEIDNLREALFLSLTTVELILPFSTTMVTQFATKERVELLVHILRAEIPAANEEEKGVYLYDPRLRGWHDADTDGEFQRLCPLIIDVLSILVSSESSSRLPPVTPSSPRADVGEGIMAPPPPPSESPVRDISLHVILTAGAPIIHLLQTVAVFDTIHPQPVEVNTPTVIIGETVDETTGEDAVEVTGEDIADSVANVTVVNDNVGGRLAVRGEVSRLRVQLLNAALRWLVSVGGAEVIGLTCLLHSVATASLLNGEDSPVADSPTAPLESLLRRVASTALAEAKAAFQASVNEASVAKVSPRDKKSKNEVVAPEPPVAWKRPQYFSDVLPGANSATDNDPLETTQLAANTAFWPFLAIMAPLHAVFYDPLVSKFTTRIAWSVVDTLTHVSDVMNAAQPVIADLNLAAFLGVGGAVSSLVSASRFGPLEASERENYLSTVERWIAQGNCREEQWRKYAATLPDNTPAIDPKTGKPIPPAKAAKAAKAAPADKGSGKPINKAEAARLAALPPPLIAEVVWNQDSSRDMPDPNYGPDNRLWCQLLNFAAPSPSLHLDTVTPLLAAIFSGQSTQAVHLIKLGVSLELTCLWGRTPLMTSLLLGDENVTEALLSAGANINTVDELGTPTLHFALCGLIPNKANDIAAEYIPSQDNLTLQYGSSRLLPLLLERHDSAIKDPTAERPLLEVVISESTLGSSPLHLALGSGRIIAFLAGRNFEIEPAAYRQLEITSEETTHQVLESLIARGAVANVSDRNGVLPIHLAAGRGDMISLKTLLTAGADPNGLDGRGCHALHWVSAACPPNWNAVVNLLMHSCVYRPVHYIEYNDSLTGLNRKEREEKAIDDVVFGVLESLQPTILTEWRLPPVDILELSTACAPWQTVSPRTDSKCVGVTPLLAVLAGQELFDEHIPLKQVCGEVAMQTVASAGGETGFDSLRIRRLSMAIELLRRASSGGHLASMVSSSSAAGMNCYHAAALLLQGQSDSTTELATLEKELLSIFGNVLASSDESLSVCRAVCGCLPNAVLRSYTNNYEVGWTPIHVAVWSGNLSLLDHLVDSSAFSYQKGQLAESLLWMLAAEGPLRGATFPTSSHGGLSNDTNEDIQTEASGGREADPITASRICEWIVEDRENAVRIFNGERQFSLHDSYTVAVSPLHVAVANGNAALVHILASQRAVDMNRRVGGPGDNRTATHLAIATKQFAVLAALEPARDRLDFTLRGGVDPSPETQTQPSIWGDSCDWNVVEQAIATGQVEALSILSQFRRNDVLSQLISTTANNQSSSGSLLWRLEEQNLALLIALDIPVTGEINKSVQNQVKLLCETDRNTLLKKLSESNRLLGVVLDIVATASFLEADCHVHEMFAAGRLHHQD